MTIGWALKWAGLCNKLSIIKTVIYVTDSIWAQREIITFFLEHLKVLYCRIDSTFKAVELCIAVQIQNVYKRFFFTRALLLRLDTQAGRQINDTNRNENTLRWMKLNALFFSANWQPSVLKYNWVNWQCFTNQNTNRQSGLECTFSKENNWLYHCFFLDKQVC